MFADTLNVLTIYILSTCLYMASFCRASETNCNCKDCDGFPQTSCQSRCQDNWYGKYCQKECIDNMFAPNCEKNCFCLHGDACDKKTGSCSNGCTAGKYGPACQQDCGDYTYGENCLNVCSCLNQCEVCNQVTETCNTGRHTTSNEDQHGVYFAVLGSVLGVACTVIAVLVLVIVRLKRKFNKYKAAKEEHYISLGYRAPDTSVYDVITASHPYVNTDVNKL